MSCCYDLCEFYENWRVYYTRSSKHQESSNLTVHCVVLYNDFSNINSTHHHLDTNIGKLETINDYDDDDRISFFRVIHLACFFYSDDSHLIIVDCQAFAWLVFTWYVMHTHTQIYAKTGFHRFQSIPDDIHYVIIQVITFFHCLRW